MKRIVQFYRFLIEYEKATRRNVETAPTYKEQLYDSGATDMLSVVRAEYERLFDGVFDTLKK